MPTVLPATNLPGGLEPIQSVHLHVDQDDGVIRFGQPPQRLLSRIGLDEVVAQLFEGGTERQQVGGLVVHQQDVRGQVQWGVFKLQRGAHGRAPQLRQPWKRDRDTRPRVKIRAANGSWAHSRFSRLAQGGKG